MYSLCCLVEHSHEKRSSILEILRRLRDDCRWKLKRISDQNTLLAPVSKRDERLDLSSLSSFIDDHSLEIESQVSQRFMARRAQSRADDIGLNGKQRREKISVLLRFQEVEPTNELSFPAPNYSPLSGYLLGPSWSQRLSV